MVRKWKIRISNSEIQTMLISQFLKFKTSPSRGRCPYCHPCPFGSTNFSRDFYRRPNAVSAWHITPRVTTFKHGSILRLPRYWKTISWSPGTPFSSLWRARQEKINGSSCCAQHRGVDAQSSKQISCPFGRSQRTICYKYQQAVACVFRMEWRQCIPC